MADPNNVPQQAQQLKEEINTPQETAGKGDDEQMVDALLSRLGLFGFGRFCHGPESR